MAETKRIKTLESLRALAFVGVFLNHTDFSVFSKLGALSVSIFFVISGFVVAINTKSQSKKTCAKSNLIYAIKKIKKLYGLYITTLLLTVIFDFFGEGKREPLTIAVRFVCNALLIQEWIPISDRSYNAPSWFLCTLFFFYFIYPYFVKKIKEISLTRAKIYIVFLFVFEIIIALLGNRFSFINPTNKTTSFSFFIDWFVYRFPLTRIIDCFAGVLLGVIYIKEKHKKTLKKANLDEALAITVIVLLMIFCEKTKDIKYLSAFTSVALFLLPVLSLVNIFAKGEGKITQFLTNKVTMYLAKISPYGFLIHDVINRYINAGFVFLFGSLNGYNYNLQYGRYIKLLFGIPITIVACGLWMKISDYVKKKRLL